MPSDAAIGTALRSTYVKLAACGGHCSDFGPPTSAPIIPSKRSDDDVQFILSKPVKRQKINQATYQHVLPSASQSDPQFQLPSRLPLDRQPDVIPGSIDFLVTNLPRVVSKSPQKETCDRSDRRMSTGMVGLPGDSHFGEIDDEMRGVSLPLLEDYVLDQPSGRPRPMSSPPLSPRQLPRPTPTSAPDSKSADRNKTYMAVHGSSRLAGDGFTANARNVCDALMTTQIPEYPMIMNTPPNPVESPSPAYAIAADHTSPSMRPLPTSCNLRCDDPSDCTRQTTPLVQQITAVPGIIRSPAQNQPCHICVQMVRRAAMARARGCPTQPTQQRPSVHNVSHIPYTPAMALASHQHAQFVIKSPPDMQTYASGLLPVTPQIHVREYTSLTAPQQGPPQLQRTGRRPQTTSSSLATFVQNSSDPHTFNTAAASHGESSPPTATRCGPDGRSTSRSRDHRPSRDLIVDVAETSLETFPFEEVAKRHDVAVQQVVNVFAALVQVPLLRCATDRRRAGELAVGRIREYQRARRCILEDMGVGPGAGVGSGAGNEFVVPPWEVAQAPGPLEGIRGLGIAD